MIRLLAITVLITVLGCGSQVEVAKTKAMERINGLLGSMDVKREDIKQSMTAFKTAVDGIRKAEIKAQVKRDQLDRLATPAKDRIAKSDKTLEKLRELLKAEKPAEIGGKTYTEDELKEMAAQVLIVRKDSQAEADGILKSQSELDQVIKTLQSKRLSHEQKIAQLETTLTEIDSQSIALKAMKEASATLGDSETTFLANVQELEDKINDFYADLQVEMLNEDAKWSESSVDTQISSVDSFIMATQGDSNDVMSEIDLVLGKED